jgi:hypothetical protein
VLTLALIVAAQGASFQEIVLPKFERFGSLPTQVRITGLTNAGLVGGYVYFPGTHGEDFLGLPFVWQEGRTHPLPLGKAEYGHVYAITDRFAVGDVSTDGADRPARWTPDPKRGWEAAKLTLLDTKDGQARVVAPDGSVWITDRDGFRSIPKREAIAKPRFVLRGFDSRGRPYGNTYEAIGYGLRAEGTRAVWRDLGRWKPFLLDDAKDSAILAVNAAGEWVGLHGAAGVRWYRDKIEPLPAPDGYRVFPKAINRHGDAVGSAGKEDRVACLWKDGRFVDLSRRVPQAKLDDAHAINDQGQIVATDGQPSRAYLLR